jgi:hypothetical protein
MAQPTFSERATAAFVGVVFGAIIGLAIAWLLGVYSSRIGPGEIQVSFSKLMLGGALFFGSIGAIFGSSVGTLIGTVIAGTFAFESSSDDERSRW